MSIEVEIPKELSENYNAALETLIEIHRLTTNTLRKLDSLPPDASPDPDLTAPNVES